jgi:S-adenosylmethionine decarboxylase
LLGLPRILEIAAAQANLPTVYRLFYSRKSFMFPERQLGPHRGWDEEVKFLDNIFSNGSAYTIGRMNGDHWLLYMVGPLGEQGSPAIPHRVLSAHPHGHHEAAISTAVNHVTPHAGDCTIEILMTHLSAEARAPFFFGEMPADAPPSAPFDQARELQSSIGITSLFPERVTTLDAYAFDPCGYSSNALLKWGAAHSDAYKAPQFDGSGGEGYYTIHVTPEEGWSYASFECNVPLPCRHANPVDDATAMPDLQMLVRRVVDIFQPGKITVTMFMSCADSASAEDDEGESAVEAAQRAFKAALTRPQSTVKPRELVSTREESGAVPPPSPSILSRFWSALPFAVGKAPVAGEYQAAHTAAGDKITTQDAAAGHANSEKKNTPWGKLYRRTDKINYEFRGYDLAFASFELR